MNPLTESVLFLLDLAAVHYDPPTAAKAAALKEAVAEQAASIKKTLSESRLGTGLTAKK